MITLRRSGRAAAAVVACTLAGPGAAVAAPGPVTVRVEGASATLQPRTSVTTTTTPVLKSGNPCPGTSAGGALELATRGDWGGAYTPGLGQAVETIRGESYPFTGPTPRYWAFWVNGQAATQGVCERELNPGDEVLFFVDCFGPGCDSPEPLRLTAPRSARRWVPFIVRVQQLDPTGRATPAPYAQIHALGGTATAGPDGRATVTLGAAGDVILAVERPGNVRTAETVCVSEGRDGTCGTRDRRAPETRIIGIADGQRFARRRAPRLIRARVREDPSGLRSVSLRLTRRIGERCAYLSGRLERFRPVRCGRGAAFRLRAATRVSYLLPARLSPGRYVLEVLTTDRAGNRERSARGRNRVVFRVR